MAGLLICPEFGPKFGLKFGDAFRSGDVGILLEGAAPSEAATAKTAEAHAVGIPRHASAAPTAMPVPWPKGPVSSQFGISVPP